MAKMEEEPHVLIFPLPIQGHINPMLNLAELFALSGLKVTFLNSEYSHQRLLRTDINFISSFAKYPGFEFKTITDGLPHDHPRLGPSSVLEIIEGMELRSKPIFREMLVNIKPPVNCIVGDGVLGEVTFDVAQENGIPIIHFRTNSAAHIWACFSIRDMIEAGELPIGGDGDMDRLITSVPGMETFLRCRDLPSLCRASDKMDFWLQHIATETRNSFKAHGLLFEDLERSILSHMRTKCSKIYTVGPIHLHLKTRQAEKTKEIDETSNSLWEVDRSCLSWLDKQPKESVVYVSFGSIKALTRDEMIEFWSGLVNCKARFLWVLRSEEEDNIFVELVERSKGKGYIVKWAPQEEVLAHSAIGGFLTHSGWNSTLESVVAGVPMICWPGSDDQPCNSRFVSEVWKLGLDMKGVWDRNVVEKIVNDLMVDNREEFVKSAAKYAKLAKECVSVGGSSYSNLDNLIEEIRSMNKKDARGEPSSI